MRRPAPDLLLIGLLLAVSGLCAQQAPLPNSAQSNPGHSQRPSEPATTLRVDVNLVNVFVTVTDAHGAPIGGLNKDNFLLKEDDVPQQIKVFDKESGLPLSIALAIDTSLSTRHDLPFEQASAKRFVHDIMRPVDGLCVYGFSETVTESTRGFTPDLRSIDEGIDHIRMGAATALYDAIYLTSHDLDRRKGRKVIVLITDGGDTISRIDYKEAVRAAEEAEAIVYSIIIVPIENSAGRETGGEHALIQLSDDTGGKFYYATSTSQLDEAFHKISDELRTQYLLAYYPSQRTSFSEFRRIEVKVQGVADASAYRVRHRVGYYTVKSD
ncbi:MAG TPA: VWA domain-containing protein [Candidatus Sulfotelmatobacter sp.]|jgi:Ca-activated chloride channel family protein|nr:VWA domain-containing protein [Candidatus Sulfotelmatobacter sp.]